MNPFQLCSIWIKQFKKKTHEYLKKWNYKALELVVEKLIMSDDLRTAAHSGSIKAPESSDSVQKLREASLSIKTIKSVFRSRAVTTQTASLHLFPVSLCCQQKNLHSESSQAWQEVEYKTF